MEDKEENKGKSINAQKEEGILKFWKENDIFNKSLVKEAPKGDYVFYDGPPFATGLPHYGHMLGSTAKDVIGRYQTMRGFHVPRKWGWDCHGLPVENIVEKDLGISGRKAIEEYGVDKFSEHARSVVLKYVAEWKKAVDRIGRWVDFDNSYKTMDNSFIESVWWALGEMNKKELLYEGVRVLAYCPRCETPIANSEIAMDNSYKDITDISVYVKFKILENTSEDQQNPAALPLGGTKNELLHSLSGSQSEIADMSLRTGDKGRHGQDFPSLPSYLLAWTTTPWTLPGNTAIAINKNITYLYIKNSEEIIIVAKDRFEILKDKFTNPEIIKEVKGDELVGLSYEPVFDYYKNSDVAKNPNIWKVWHADFVTADTGTGIAHEAPAFGEDDMNLAKENNIPFIRHVDPTGVFAKEVTDFAGEKVKPKEDHQSGDVLIIKYLAKQGVLFAKEKIIHSYPHCYRCDTPLLYYALPSWFVNIQKVKNDLLEKAKEMNWIPEHLKDGRFKNIMENAPDWTISRNRFWASPLPIWKSESGKILFVNSLEDLKNKTKKSSKFIVMRHGEGEHNIKEIMTSDSKAQYHLTSKGQSDVEQQANKLKEKNIKTIYSSPFLRTKETAELVAEIIGIPKDKIIYDDRLGDNHTGEEYEEKPQKNFVNWILDTSRTYTDIPSSGGESFKDVKIRFGNALKEIFEKNTEGEVLIISHGISFMVIPAILEGADDEQSHKLLKDALGKTNPGEYMEYNWVPLSWNANYELDLHRPYIDAITLVDEEGVEYKRIPEVIDCWFESGSMPFAQDHYPFARPDWKEKNFPAGFVAEYIAQTRTWFYYTHTISTILFGSAPFQNVVTTGTVLAEDGSKMSKSKNNFPDPWILFDKYGVDALRFYLMSSSLMKGEDVNFSEKIVQEVASKIIGRLDNVVAFYELYRDEDVESNKQKSLPAGRQVVSENILDQWILARLNELVGEVTQNMEIYDMAQATRPFELFIEDLSTWYLRRSREALKNGDKNAKSTLYYVLKTTVKLLAPFTPFIAESIWQKLKLDDEAESVHLAEWPKQVESSKQKVESVIEEMQKVRNIVSEVLMVRQKFNVKVRQPLGKLEIQDMSLKNKLELIELIKDEINVEVIIFNEKLTSGFNLDTTITEDLKRKGDYRELLRAVQDMRKKNGLIPSDMVTLYIYTDKNGEELVKEFENDFLKTVGAKSLNFKENEGEEIKIDKYLFKILVEK